MPRGGERLGGFFVAALGLVPYLGCSPLSPASKFAAGFSGFPTSLDGFGLQTVEDLLRCFIYAVPVVPVSPGLLVQQVYGLGGIALRGQQTCVFVPVDRGQVIVVVCRSSIQLGLGLFAEALRLINAIIGCLYFVLHALRTHGIADGQASL